MMAAVIADDRPLAQEVYEPESMDTLFDIVENVPVATFYQGSQGL